MNNTYFTKKYSLRYLHYIFFKSYNYKQLEEKLNNNEYSLLSDRTYFHINNINEFSEFLSHCIKYPIIETNIFKHFVDKFSKYISKKERIVFIHQRLIDGINDVANIQSSNGYLGKSLDKYYYFLDKFELTPPILLHNQDDKKQTLSKKMLLFLTQEDDDSNGSFFYNLSQNLKKDDFIYVPLYKKILENKITWPELSMIYREEFFMRYKKLDPLFCAKKLKNLIDIINDDKYNSLINSDKKVLIENLYFDLMISNSENLTKKNKI